MNRMMIALIALLLAAACGNGEGGPAIGDPCTSSKQHCTSSPKAACIANWPAGYCTESPCEMPNTCRGGSSCVSGNEFQMSELAFFCLKTCTSTTDCRDGYRCYRVSTGEHVCTPIPTND